MRYVIRPGEVTSRTDGQLHYVNSSRLLQLYCVPKDADIIYDSSEHGPIFYRPDDIICEPRYDGNYPLFKKTKQ